VLAKRAFDKQSEEVRILQWQANDSAEMLRIQSDQLDAQHDQLHSLQKVSEKQIEVLGLQATDLRESLEERKRDTAQRRRAQASRVFVTELRHPYISDPSVMTGGTAYVKVTV
jgi:ribosomal protein S15P/S13E